MTKIDLLFLTHNRKAFTVKTLELLMRNTNWAHVAHLYVVDDMSEDGAGAAAKEIAEQHRSIMLDGWDPFDGVRDGYPAEWPAIHFVQAKFGGPVAVMRYYLEIADLVNVEMFAKIDSDTAVPAGWLDICMDVMQRNSDLDLLGIEAMTEPEEILNGEPRMFQRTYRESSHIGGIGLMRTRAFRDRKMPTPNGRFGFTEWQHAHEEVKRGFLYPAMKVALLDRTPREPWASLSAEYVAKGWQRYWPPYPEQSHADWDWVCK